MRVKGKVFCAAVAVSAMILAILPIHAAETLYESKTTQTVCKGVTYEESRLVTEAGLLDVHVLRVGLTDPYIMINPVESAKEYGLKEPVSALLGDAGAVAGVNADFFGTNGSYSAGFGPTIKDGGLVSVSADTNGDGYQFASLLFTKSGVPFISFIKADIHFYNDGAENIEVHSINKVTDMVYPIIVTKAAMPSTAQLDARFPNLLKIVVENSQITYKSQLGETVLVPENGYALVIQEASAEYFGQFFRVGQSASLKVQPQGIDFDIISAAIGGGGLILQEGQTVGMGTIVNGAKREPRTAVGINKEKTEMVLVEVDGRSHSIGATQEEMAAILKKYGAYNAMHFDGGGSSTMVTKGVDGSYNVMNQVSDGSERRVINALGVFNGAPVGGVEKLVVSLGKEKALLGEAVKVSVYGLDGYGRRVGVEADSVTSDDPNGQLMDGQFTPGTAGTAVISAQYGEMSAEAKLKVNTLAELSINPEDIRLNPSESKRMSFTGIDSSGERVNVTSGLTYEIYPPELGTAAAGEFTAQSAGVGYIKCTAFNVSAYIAAYVGDTGDAKAELPDKQRFRDPMRGEPNESLQNPAAIIEGEKVLDPKARGPFEYGARQNGRFAILRMAAANGGLLATDAWQWLRFRNDIEKMDAGAIVIETDINPFNYAQSKEFELFHSALASYQGQGKQVFVVSKQGNETSTRIQGGVRYINLGAMWKDAETANENYRVFKLYAVNDIVTYTLTAQ